MAKTRGLGSKFRQLTRSPYRRSKAAAKMFANYIGQTLANLRKRGKSAVDKTLRVLRLKKGGHRRRR